MGERFTDDELSSDESSKGKEEKRWVKPPLVPNSLDLLRDSKETAPLPPPPNLLEQVLGKDLLERQVSNEDGEDDSEESSETSEETADVAGEATPEAAGEEPASAEEGPDESVLHIRREPPAYAREQASAEEEDEPRHAYTGGSSSSTPPPPPPPLAPPAAAGAPNQGPMFNFNMAPPSPGNTINQYNTAPSPQISVEQHRADLKETERDSEKRGLRRGLVAGFITGYVLKAYLANRKRERYEKATEKQLNQRDEQISQLQREQQRLTEQMAARVEEYRQRQEAVAGNRPTRFEGAGAPRPNAEALQQAEKYEGEHLFDQEGNEIILQPGWRVERSAGGYSVVLDEHNRVVHDAIRYGEAFKREQKREQLSDDLFAAVGGGSTVPGPSGGGGQFALPQPSQPAQSAQQPGVLLSSDHKEVDLKHRLPEPRSQLMATVASPWVWTAIAILIIIYFIAALA